MNSLVIGNRRIEDNYPPLVIAEIGINHEGDREKTIRMVDDTYKAGCECVKFQCHVIEDEMIPNDVVPGHHHGIDMGHHGSLKLPEDQGSFLKKYVE